LAQAISASAIILRPDSLRLVGYLLILPVSSR